MKKKLVAILMVLVMALGVGIAFVACDGNVNDPILDSILEQLDQLQREAAQNSRDAVLAEVELMLLERDLEALRASHAALNAQISMLEAAIIAANNAVNIATTARDNAQLVRSADSAFTTANAAVTTAQTAFNNRVTYLDFQALNPASITAGYDATAAQVATSTNRNVTLTYPLVAGQPITTLQAEEWTIANSNLADLRANYEGDAQLVAARGALVAAQATLATIPTNVAWSVANSNLTSANAHYNLLSAHLGALREERAEVQYEIETLNTRIRGAGIENYVRMLVDHLNRRFVRQGDYIIVPNRFFAEQVAGRPTIARPDSVAPSRAISVQVAPQAVAVMCPSHLDILVSLGVYDRVVAFTHLDRPAFLYNYFPDNTLPDLWASEPHSPDFTVIDELDRLDLVLFSSRARDRDTRFGRDYFGRLSYIAPTLDLGSRSGVDTFMQDVIENVLILGAIFDVQDRAFDEVVEFVTRQREINALATSLEATALIVQFNGVRNMALFGAASRYSFVHRELGIGQATGPYGDANPAIANVAYQHGTPAGAELLRDVNPDIIFVVDRYALNSHRRYTDGTMMDTPIDILSHELFAGMDAVYYGNIHYLDPVNWYLILCGFRSLKYQFEEVYTALRALEASRA